MTVVYHPGYDFIVLVIPLCYALREGTKNIRSIYYLFVIGMIWFIDKFILVVANQGLSTPHGGHSSLFFWLKVLVFYGTLCTDWFIAFKSRAGKVKSVALG